MDLILFAIDFILHVDVHLKELFENYGIWVYAILFLIIFCETGLVVTPFLPGDSLLFAAGALTVGSVLDVHTLAAVLLIAAVLGNVVNYTIGHFFGEQLFAVFLRDLVVVRVDFAEGQKTVAIAPEIDERRLQRRFDAGYLGEVDVAFDLLVFSGFKVEFFNPVALEHRHPGFFLVARID